MDQTKSIKLQKKRLERAEERRARLDKANERARAKRRMETEEQKFSLLVNILTFVVIKNTIMMYT